MAAFLAFAPQAIAAATEINRAPRAQRFLIGLAVHPGKHEDRTSLRVLSDRRHQTTGLAEVDHSMLLCSSRRRRSVLDQAEYFSRFQLLPAAQECQFHQECAR